VDNQPAGGRPHHRDGPVQRPFPFALRVVQIRLELRIRRISGRELIVELLQLRLLIRERGCEIRRRVADAAELSVLGHIIEVGKQLIELFLRERVEPVIVAARATQRQTQKHRGGRVDAIDDVFHGVLFGNDSAF